MANQKMKTHLFKVKGASLLAIVKKLMSMDLERRRIREIKLEHSLCLENDLYAMDLAKHREFGPGRSSKNEITKGFDLRTDEGFGEMTAILYDNKRQFILVQYNHYGPRATSICEYFNQSLGGGSLDFDPVLKKGELEKLNTHKYAKQVFYAIEFPNNKFPPTTDIDSRVKHNWDIAQKTGMTNIGRIEVTLKQYRGGSVNRMLNCLQYCKSLLKNKNMLQSLKVEVSQEDNRKIEMLNLLQSQEEIALEGLIRDGTTRMYSFDSRYNILLQAHEKWLKAQVIHD